MENRLDQLIQRATLDILEFGNQTRYSMETINRTLGCYVMTYLKSGRATISLRGKEYDCTSGTIALLPPNEPHNHIACRNLDDPAVFLWWHFRYQIGGVLDVLRLLHYPITFQMGKSIMFESVFRQYMELNQSNGSLPDIVMRKAKELEILALLFESMFSQPGTSYRLETIPTAFYQILYEIVERPENGVHLPELAQRFHMHPTYISNRFKHHFGITPARLQRGLIVDKAKCLLRAGNVSIGEISDRLGFCDISAFTQAFTENAGMSPTQFRQKAALDGICKDDTIHTISNG